MLETQRLLNNTSQPRAARKSRKREREYAEKRAYVVSRQRCTWAPRRRQPLRAHRQHGEIAPARFRGRVSLPLFPNRQKRHARAHHFSFFSFSRAEPSLLWKNQPRDTQFLAAKLRHDSGREPHLPVEEERQHTVAVLVRQPPSVRHGPGGPCVFWTARRVSSVLHVTRCVR